MYVYIYILLYGNLKIHIWKSSKIMIFANFRKCYKNAAPKKRRIERWLGSQATHFLHSVRQSKCPPQLSAKNMINLAKNNIPLDFNCFRDPNRKGEFGTQIQTVRNDLHDKSSENLNNWDATLNSKNMQECHCQELTHWYWEIWEISYYHLVMTNSLPWKITMLLIR